MKESSPAVETPRGFLAVGEPHPAAHTAFVYVRSIPPVEIMAYEEALASSAMAGNRLAEICAYTLHRVVTGAPVSDRYLLGLAWMLRDMRENLSGALDKPKK